MAEINNNIPKFGYNIEKIDNIKNKSVDVMPTEVQPEQVEQNIVPDTGVLGRSQVRNSKGADITKSVDEAVTLAKTNPALLECGDEIFNSVYDMFIEQGMDEGDAYANASLALEEFLSIV